MFLASIDGNAVKQKYERQTKISNLKFKREVEKLMSETKTIMLWLYKSCFASCDTIILHSKGETKSLGTNLFYHYFSAAKRV